MKMKHGATVVVGLVAGGYTIEDLGIRVPLGGRAELTAEQASSSTDLWRAVAQRQLFCCQGTARHLGLGGFEPVEQPVPPVAPPHTVPATPVAPVAQAAPEPTPSWEEKVDQRVIAHLDQVVAGVEPTISPPWEKPTPKPVVEPVEEPVPAEKPGVAPQVRRKGRQGQ